MVADYRIQTDRESRFSARLRLNERICGRVTCAEYRRSGPDWVRGARPSQRWQEASIRPQAETGH